MKKTLIVEDDARLAQIIVDVLQEHGHPALFATTTATALECLAQDEEIFTVLADYKLDSNMNGLMLLERARGVRKSLRCILMSGDVHSIEGDLSEVELLKKPVRMRQLVAIVVDGEDSGISSNSLS